MLAVEITLTILPFAGVLVLAFASGFLLRGNQLKAYKRKVIELEKEMLSNHAEILDLQKERATLLRQMKESQIPVIPMISAKDDGEKRQAK